MMTEPKRPEPGRSLWTRPARAARGPAPEHSRAEIAAAGVALADASGIGAVTMRSAAAAIGTAPASLYRYVASREELVQLMADQVYGEFSLSGPGTGHPVPDLLELARQGLAIYRRHPWLLDVPPTGNLPGPNAVAFIERSLAALAGTDLTGSARLETVGLFSGVVRLFAQTEIGQQRAGQETAQLAGIAGPVPGRDRGRGPAPAPGGRADRAARPGEPAATPAAGDEPTFDRAMTRILNGLLQPAHP